MSAQVLLMAVVLRLVWIIGKHQIFKCHSGYEGFKIKVFKNGLNCPISTLVHGNNILKENEKGLRKVLNRKKMCDKIVDFLPTSGRYVSFGRPNN